MPVTQQTRRRVPHDANRETWMNEQATQMGTAASLLCRARVYEQIGPWNVPI
jgi:hypothetical protein